MNRYEGMFIFTDLVKTDDVDAAVIAVREEIEKMDGVVEYSTRLGKRAFARPLRKQESGQYAVVTFTCDGTKLTELSRRYNLMEQILRVQFIKLSDEASVPVPAEATSEKSNG